LELPIYIVPCKKTTKSCASIKKTLELLYNENCLKYSKVQALRNPSNCFVKGKTMFLKEDQRGNSSVLVQKFQRSLSQVLFKKNANKKWQRSP